MPTCPNKHLPSDDSDDEKESVKTGKQRRGVRGRGRKVESEDKNMKNSKGKKEKSGNKTPAKKKKNAGKMTRKESTESELSFLEEENEEEGQESRIEGSISSKKRKLGKAQKQDLEECEKGMSDDSEENENENLKKLKHSSGDEDSADNMNLSERLTKSKTSPKKNHAQKQIVQEQNDVEMGTVENDEPPSTDSLNETICEQCGLEFAKLSIKRHRTREHKFPCPFCDKRFISKPKLNIHRKIHSDTKDSTRPSSVEEFDCEVCGIRITKNDINAYPHAVDEHSNIEHSFACGSCPRKFTSAERLNVHDWSSHEGQLSKEFKCYQCEIEFKNEDGHIRIVEFENHVSREHKVECNKCKTRFTEDDNPDSIHLRGVGIPPS